jgi:hypothetical protein
MPKMPGDWPKTPKSHTTLAGDNDKNYHPGPLGMAVTHSRHKFAAVSIQKRFRNKRGRKWICAQPFFFFRKGDIGFKDYADIREYW